MTLREIVTVPAPVLRRKARKVTDFGPDLQTLIDDMVETMRDAPGVGLAASQVGVPLRLLVIEYDEKEEQEEQEETEGEADVKKKPPRLYVMVNPEITRFSEEHEMGTEGCLSIPGFAGNVDRPIEIQIRGQNRRGQNMKVKADGWLARIFQHEMDHLDGVLFTDRAERVWRLEEGEEPPLD
jgi:peptide deformylase